MRRTSLPPSRRPRVCVCVRAGPQGKEPENIDKEFLRLWYRDNCDPYNDATVPDAPVELVEELSRRYIYLYEQITGTDFAPAAPETLDLEYMERQIAEALAEL